MGSGADISFTLDDVEKRKKVDVKNEEGKKEKLPLFFDGESVSGTVSKNLTQNGGIMTMLHPLPSLPSPGEDKHQREEVGASRDKGGVCGTDRDVL